MVPFFLIRCIVFDEKNVLKKITILFERDVSLKRDFFIKKSAIFYKVFFFL